MLYSKGIENRCKFALIFSSSIDPKTFDLTINLSFDFDDPVCKDLLNCLR